MPRRLVKPIRAAKSLMQRNEAQCQVLKLTKTLKSPVRHNEVCPLLAKTTITSAQCCCLWALCAEAADQTNLCCKKPKAWKGLGLATQGRVAYVPFSQPAFLHGPVISLVATGGCSGID